MPFNFGAVVAIKSSFNPGGGYLVTYIRGSSTHYTRGSDPTPASLPIWGTNTGQTLGVDSPTLIYPIGGKFNCDGYLIIPFLFDMASIPGNHTLSSNNQIATTYRYRLKIGSLPREDVRNLLWFSNIADVSRVGLHFRLPTFRNPAIHPILAQKIQTISAELEGSARRLYACVNSWSRPCLFDFVVI